MMSFQFGMYGLMIENTLKIFTGHLQVQAPGYIDDQKMRQTVPDIIPLANSIRAGLESDTVAARAQTFALASSEERSYGIAIYGVEPKYEAKVSSVPGLISEGRFLRDVDASEIVIGSLLARNLRIGLGDEITLLGSGVDGSFAAAVVEVVGIFSSGARDIDRNIAEIPLVTFQDIFFMEGAGHQISITGADLDAVSQLQAEVRSLLPDNGDLVTHDWTALQPGVKQAIQADMGSSFFMYFILVVLVAFSVLNTQLMSVLERTREFGIVMSLGLKPARLGRLVMLEAGLMGLIGTALGVIAGAILTTWVGTVGFTMPGMDEMAAQFNLPSRIYPQASLLTLFAGPLVVFLFTLLASIYPALRLRWLHPVEAMRAA